jgi:hypothetical protein
MSCQKQNSQMFVRPNVFNLMRGGGKREDNEFKESARIVTIQITNLFGGDFP